MVSHSTVLVVGPIATEVLREDLTAFAFDVCDQLGHPTVVATSDAIDVRDFAGVVVYGPSLTNSNALGINVALILEAEAYAHGVPVIVPQSVSRAAACDACGQYQTIATVRNGHGEVFCAPCAGDAPGCSHCLSDERTEPVYVDGGWVPQCKGCARITKALKPSEWNVFDEAEQPRTLFGITA